MARFLDRPGTCPAIHGRAFGRARADGAQALDLTLEIGKRDFLGAA
jgi:hypothetical protein